MPNRSFPLQKLAGYAHRAHASGDLRHRHDHLLADEGQGICDLLAAHHSGLWTYGSCRLVVITHPRSSVIEGSSIRWEVSSCHQKQHESQGGAPMSSAIEAGVESPIGMQSPGSRRCCGSTRGSFL